MSYVEKPQTPVKKAIKKGHIVDVDNSEAVAVAND